MREEQAVQCTALGCCEPRREDEAEFCANHERQIHAFQRWLEGADERCWPATRSFDYERYIWSGPQRSA
jgi:hypothetical protein